MPDELCVSVPDDLASELEEEGIEELVQDRGLEWVSQSATMAVTIVGAAANVTTVLLARGSIARFVHRISSWAAGKANAAPGSELKIRFVSWAADGKDINIEIIVRSPDPEPPAADKMATLMSFIADAFTADSSAAD